MGKIASISGGALFVGSYALLYLGLFGSLVEYQYTVVPSKTWFNGSPHETAWNLVFAMVSPPPVTVIPRTVRSLLGQGARLEEDATVSAGAAAAAPQAGAGAPSQALSSFLDVAGLVLEEQAEAARHPARATAGLARRQGRLAPGAGDGGPASLLEAEALGDAPAESSLIEFLLGEARAGRVGYFAPVALIAFGIVLPLVKFGLVALFMLSSTGAISGKFGASNLRAASLLSRWAAVDAVAEAGVVALLLQAGVYAKHELGYTSFIGYVFLSGFAIWLMLPEEPRQPWLTSQVLPGHRRLAALTLPLTTITFIVFLYFGAAHYSVAMLRAELSVESVEAQIHAYMSTKGGGTLAAGRALLGDSVYEAMVREFAEKLPRLSAELSVDGMVRRLVQSGHVHTVTGSIAIFVGVLLMPLMEAVLCLMVAATAQASFDRHTRGALACLQSCALFVAEFSFLDVFVVGIAVCMGVMNSFGALRLNLMPGFAYLAAAAGTSWLNKYLLSLVTAPSRLDMLEEKGLPGPACFEDTTVKR